MPKKPIITYADMDIGLFKAASSGEQIQYIYSDGDKEIARFNSADAGKKWLDEVEIMGVDFEHGYEGDHITLTRSIDYIDLGVEKAYEVFDNILEDYKKLAGTKQFTGYVSKSTGAEVFRNKIATIKKYKGSRVSRKPSHLEAVRKYALSKPDIKKSTGRVKLDGVNYGIETDDQTQALAQRKGELGQLMTFDKDGLTAVGCHVLNLNYFDESVFSDPSTVGFLEKSGDNIVGIGYLFFLAQMIMGDSIDAITGVPKGGKKKALEVLAPFNNQPISELPKAFEEVAKLYKKAYGDRHEYKHWETEETIVRNWYEMMIEQGQLLYMLRGKDDSFEKSVLKYYKGETP